MWGLSWANATAALSAFGISARPRLVTAGAGLLLPEQSSNFTIQVLTDPLPYSFPPLGHDGSKLFSMPDCHGFKLEEATIDQTQKALSSGLLSSVQLVGCYLNRIYQVDSYLRYDVVSTGRSIFLYHDVANRVISSIMQLNPDMLKIAASLDWERSQGHIRGPLHGVPFIVKDNIASKDRMETTAGSYALLGSIVPRDAHVVSRLRAAGAVLLGKAAMSEWADMRSSNYSEGYSARGGQCRSAYNLTVNPGGSSTGSAVAVAANAVSFALGTETDGSGKSRIVGTI